MAHHAIAVPKGYFEPLEAEHLRLGYATKTQTIKSIFDFYFANKDGALIPDFTNKDKVAQVDTHSCYSCRYP